MKTILYILSRPYKWVMAFRNYLYNTKLKTSKKGALPTIGIGNITVGGTGKTPHSEYIINLLQDKLNIAYLSRGYKRKTKGYKDTTKQSSAQLIGDEAYQIHSKFPKITVAVCEKRLKGIETIKQKHPDTQLVILDDVYQHRAITPDINILLIDYNRPVYYDHHLPLGQLRESNNNTDRADIIIITKCPDDIMPVDRLAIRSQINPFPFQKLLFSKISYCTPSPIYNTQIETQFTNKHIIAVSGLAQDNSYIKHLQSINKSLSRFNFPDHHNYTHKDVKRIEKEISRLGDKEYIIVITEKDKAKFDALQLPASINEHIFTIGIKIEFLFNEEETFTNAIHTLTSKL